MVPERRGINTVSPNMVSITASGQFPHYTARRGGQREPVTPGNRADVKGSQEARAGLCTGAPGALQRVHSGL